MTHADTEVLAKLLRDEEKISITLTRRDIRTLQAWYRLILPRHTRASDTVLYSKLYSFTAKDKE